MTTEVKIFLDGSMFDVLTVSHNEDDKKVKIVLTEKEFVPNPLGGDSLEKTKSKEISITKADAHKLMISLQKILF